MSAAKGMICSIHYEVRRLQAELKPFDAVHDEDTLLATEEHHSIIVYEIDRLQMMLVDALLNIEFEEAPDEEEQAHVDELNRKLTVFTQRKKDLSALLDELRCERHAAHTVWKANLLKTTEALVHHQTRVRTLESILQFITGAAKERVINSRISVFTWIHLHAQANTLLTLCGFKKGNSPFAALRMATKMNLIDEATYRALCK